MNTHLNHLKECFMAFLSSIGHQEMKCHKVSSLCWDHSDHLNQYVYYYDGTECLREHTKAWASINTHNQSLEFSTLHCDSTLFHTKVCLQPPDRRHLDLLIGDCVDLPQVAGSSFYPTSWIKSRLKSGGIPRGIPSTTCGRSTQALISSQKSQ